MDDLSHLSNWTKISSFWKKINRLRLSLMLLNQMGIDLNFDVSVGADAGDRCEWCN